MSRDQPHPSESADVVVIGGGSCGSVLAGRLSEDPSRRVLLVESAPGHRIPSEYPPELVDAGVLPVGPDSRWVWPYQVNLTSERSGWIARGRVLGGSGAVNGGYFVRAQTDDFDRWPRSWSFDEVLPYYKRIESDADFTGPWHGSDGPIPVHREPRDRWHPVSSAFVDVARDAGHAEDPDKNAPGSHGVGPVPLNIRDGVRVGPASAYLLPNLGRPNLTVRSGATVTKVLFDGTRVAGLEIATEDGLHTIRASTVVLTAGAVATPHLLMLSGVGDARHLRDLGIEVVADLPAVGSGFSDHPEVVLPYSYRVPVPRTTSVPALQVTLNADGIEMRPYTASFGDLIPGSGIGRPCLGVVLMKPHSRGEIRLVSADPGAPPSVSYRYLESAADRDALRAAVLHAADLMRTGAMRALVDPDDVDTSDEWLSDHLGTSLHLSGSCRMGADPATSVVDEECRVHGVDGLFIVDTSIFPAIPGRGPHATAVMVAERASTLL
ncbi:mycofactocin system GMC family oxidoreductase MftG [Rhodococcus hoagii]|uniref:Mycofactocin system GMC family oxidoreductase MftG n=1 Tax=Rhodococcus hoagii TaxID=43767 RepID=A0AAE2W9J7_RHOHA|nr:mycofactocin system GMC family oxidoreductase MftG [Prescottella equi]MBM4485920.1 mycofactocin system GMC family oxidoreductase MftG [Prescottella equi]MBM4538160.1 mycofactocin system GMC family oxidoreductase MftG [Prescottella equi]MBM4716581.1 mycofactocin system GMC family oxidoreductase MftG [Prescottella equi]NKS09660.1 mycofactocin system GMC family oxidoreductase MftG [Prescottella equi]UNQ38701.1 mycofactocin system GMC family oxidoreductase MftG [Prescottella equi]